MAAEQEVSPENTFDLGNTGLDMRQPDGLPVEQPRDPATGRFVSDPIPVEPQEQLAPAAPVHPSYLVNQALELGFDHDDISAMPTEALGRAVYRSFRAREQARSQNVVERVRSDAEVRSPAPEPEFNIDLGSDLDGYDPNIVKAIKTVGQQSLERVRKLENELGQERAKNKEREQKQAFQILDSAFARLGKEYEPIFGKGTGASLGDKPEMKRRIAVLNAAGVRLDDINPHTIVEQIRDAAEMLSIKPSPATPATDPYAAVNGGAKKPRISPEEWNAASLARPTAQRGAAEPPGEKKAIENLKRRFAQEDAGETDSEITDGLL